MTINGIVLTIILTVKVFEFVNEGDVVEWAKGYCRVLSD